MKLKKVGSLLALSFFLLSSTQMLSAETLSVGKRSSLRRVIKALSIEREYHFVAGDKISIDFKLEGDVLSLSQAQPVEIEVQKDFYLKMRKDDRVLLSWDGEEYLDLEDQIGGKISLSFGGGGLLKFFADINQAK